MNIPHYTEVYKTHSHDHCDDKKIKTSYALDTSKSTSIVDVTGELRYIVKFECATDESQILGYQVKVYRPKTSIEESDDLILDVYPNDGYEYDYVKAQIIFNDFIKKYSLLIDAEMSDFSDMNVYRERIEYTITQPECCGTCKYCEKRHNHHNQCASNKHYMFECHNPENKNVFKCMTDCSNINFKHPVHKSKLYLKSAWDHLPWQKEHNHCRDHRDYIPLNPSYPGVELFGKCKNYVKKGC